MPIPEYETNKKPTVLQAVTPVTREDIVISDGINSSLSPDYFSTGVFTFIDDLNLDPAFDNEVFRWINATEDKTTPHPLHAVTRNLTPTDTNIDHPVTLLAQKTANKIDPQPVITNSNSTKELAKKVAVNGTVFLLHRGLKVGIALHKSGLLKGAFSS